MPRRWAGGIMHCVVGPVGESDSGRRREVYARMSMAEVQPGKMEELISISRDSVLPAAKQQQGYEGGLWLTDPEKNKAVIVTFSNVSDTTPESGTADQNRCQPCSPRARCRPHARPMPRLALPCMPLLRAARPLSRARAGALRESWRR